jgi:hypothetical protein
MSKMCSGLVKADPKKVEKALLSYEVAYNEAKTIATALLERAKVDKVQERTWYGKKVEVRVLDWLYKKEIALMLGGMVVGTNEMLSRHYPGNLNLAQVIILNQHIHSLYHDLKKMFEHNPEEMYLNSSELTWVSHWLLS